MPPIILFLIMVFAGIGFIYVGMKGDSKTKMVSIIFAVILIVIGGFGLFTAIL